MVNAGASYLGISDHFLVYLIRKTNCQQTSPRIIQLRVLKNFYKSEFLRDLIVKPWHDVDSQTNPNCPWDIWKTLLMESITVNEIDGLASRLTSKGCGAGGKIC